MFMARFSTKQAVRWPGQPCCSKAPISVRLTDASGKFVLNVPDSGVLVISYIGYKTEEIAVNGRSELIVNIQELNKGLDEVVVIGYQSQKRSDLTGAVAVVNVNDVARLPVATVEQGLQGQAAGLRVTQSTGQPGEGVAVRIRGVGTINNDDPLYIIDGVPTKDGINFLSSNDIASITVSEGCGFGCHLRFAFSERCCGDHHQGRQSRYGANNL